ncbi:lysozyme [Burkholderia sp. JPY481]
MKYSQDGLHLTEQFEGFRDTAYQDEGGIWTIGYGHTVAVHPGMVCTQEQAIDWLMDDVSAAENAVNLLVKVGLTQDEFDALVDFTFNCGIGNFQRSTLLAKLNTNDIQGAIDEFEKWDQCDGKVVAGLLRRRNAERALFTLGADFSKEVQPQPESAQ